MLTDSLDPGLAISLLEPLLQIWPWIWARLTPLQ